MEVALIVDIKHVVNKDDNTHLENLDFRQKRVCSARFVAALLVS